MSTNHSSTDISATIDNWAATLGGKGEVAASAYANGFFGALGAHGGSRLPTNPNDISPQQADALLVALNARSVQRGDKQYYRSHR